MKSIIFFFFAISLNIYASPISADLVMMGVTRYNDEATSLSLKDTKLSKDVPEISYLAVRPDYLLLAGFKYLPRQHIGSTALGSLPIELEQKGWKYELGAGYKFYLTEDLFVGPALLYSDYYNTLYKIAGTMVLKTERHDSDLRFYGLVGYKLNKATMILATLELKNDILSNDYNNDYSQYPISATLHHFLSKKWLVYAKYDQSLRNKTARTDITGNRASMAYGVGVGMAF